jgi:hypothetical protein
MFRLSAKALKAGDDVTFAQACELYYEQEMLGKKGSVQRTVGANARQKSAVSTVQLVHQDSEQHVLLQSLVQLLRCCCHPVCCGCLGVCLLPDGFLLPCCSSRHRCNTATHGGIWS